MNKYFLESIYNSQKSFYNKAYVISNNKFISLYSYNTFIIAIDRESKELIYSHYWDYSQTTLRHLKEFLKQNESFLQHNNYILKDYSKKSIENFLNKYAKMEHFIKI